jgi:MFS family permease
MADLDDSRVSKDISEKEINYKYQIGLFGNLFLACMQAGFAIGSNNLVGQILQVKLNWDPSLNILFNTLLTSSVILGMVLGSFFSGWIIACGRRATIMTMTFLIIVSSSASLLLEFYTIISAKFLQGFAAASIVSASQIYIAETSPPNRIGLFGSLVNLGIVTGLSVYFL